jgi:hypothetical protein
VLMPIHATYRDLCWPGCGQILSTTSKMARWNDIRGGTHEAWYFLPSVVLLGSSSSLWERLDIPATLAAD